MHIHELYAHATRVPADLVEHIYAKIYLKFTRGSDIIMMEAPSNRASGMPRKFYLNYGQVSRVDTP